MPLLCETALALVETVQDNIAKLQAAISKLTLTEDSLRECISDVQGVLCEFGAQTTALGFDLCPSFRGYVTFSKRKPRFCSKHLL